MSEPKLEDCDRSEPLELEDSIKSMPLNSDHSEGQSASGDLPTPPFAKRLPAQRRGFAGGILFQSRPIVND
jgi:hypothetical protein